MKCFAIHHNSNIHNEFQVLVFFCNYYKSSACSFRPQTKDVHLPLQQHVLVYFIASQLTQLTITIQFSHKLMNITQITRYNLVDVRRVPRDYRLVFLFDAWEKSTTWVVGALAESRSLSNLQSLILNPNLTLYCIYSHLVVGRLSQTSLNQNIIGFLC